MTNVTNQPSETPDPFHVLKEGLITKKGLKGKKDITLKDLAKIRGEGLGMVATSYNQLKLLVTKGLVIKDKDIAKIMSTLDDKKLESISTAFEKIQKKDVNLTKPPPTRLLTKLYSGEKLTEAEEKEIKQNFKDIKSSKKNIKQIKQTTKEAQVFANMIIAHMPRISGTPLTEKINYDTATTAIEKSEDASTRLNAVLFLEKNMEGILKSTLYELRSQPNWKEGTDGPGKDFVNFIGNREIKDEEQLAQAVKDFQNHIREGGMSTEALKNYSPKNKTLTTFQNKTFDSSKLVKSLNETPLETLNILREKNLEFRKQQQLLATVKLAFENPSTISKDNIKEFMTSTDFVHQNFSRPTLLQIVTEINPSILSLSDKDKQSEEIIKIMQDPKHSFRIQYIASHRELGDTSGISIDKDRIAAEHLNRIRNSIRSSWSYRSQNNNIASLLNDEVALKEINELKLSDFKKILTLQKELKTKNVTEEELFELIRNPLSRPLLENVYANNKNEISFQFFVKAAAYEEHMQIFKNMVQLKEYSKSLNDQHTTMEKELKNLIFGGELNLEPHREEILKNPNLEDQISMIKDHLLKLESTQYNEDIKKVFITGEKLPVERV